MANRKVLINRHTTGSTAPVASTMYKGEIAVAHKTGEETIWTKNNNDVMVPFISCAQTIAIIESKIQSSDTDVMVKAGEQHLEVSAGTGDEANKFTLNTVDVQSEEEFKAYSAATQVEFYAYSAATKESIEEIADAVDILTNVVVTAISGDTIIVAELEENGTGSNKYNLTHRAGEETNGFKKLTTDAYGHVTASTDVTTADIEALGFKTSADTDDEIAELSGATQAISGYAATQISQLSAGTQHDIETLSGDVVEYVKVVSGNIETVINELSAGTLQLSADTHSAIAAAIDALDSDSATTDNRHYVTAITIEDGKIVSFGEATDPQLSVESAGTGNVVSKIEVADHKITYQTVSVATSEDIQALSASVINLSAATTAISEDLEELSGITEDFSGYTDAKFTALSAGTIQLSADTKATIEQLSAGTIQLSADTYAAINQLSGYAHGEIVELSAATESAFTAILGMDKAADAVAGQVVTTVAETDGVVSETKAHVKDLQLGGYVKDTTATGDIASADTINAALSKLENKANAITIANADGSINVTTGATGTDVNVNIKSGEHVLAKDGNAGLYTDIKLSGVTPTSTTVKEEYVLYGTDGTVLGDHIKIYKDSHIVSITYISDPSDAHYQNLEYKYLDADGNEQTEYVDVSSLVLEAEFASGVGITNHIAHGVVDPNSESFLTVGGDGFKLSGVQDAIDDAIEALDVTGDTAAAGQYVAAIEQTDGVVAVKTRANVSEAVLNNYVKGSDASAVAATDSVNAAISKLENQVDAAKAAATTKVVEGTDAGNNMTIVSATGADDSVTYTINLTDIASDAALEAVSGIVDTFSAATVAEFNSAFTAINTLSAGTLHDIEALSGDVVAYVNALSANAHNSMIARDDAVFSSAVTYVDEQIDEVYASAVSYTDSAITYAIEGLDSVGSASTTGHYLTSVTITDGKISAVGEVAVPAATPVTTVAGTTGDTASAVLTGITTGGTDGHELTLNATNKIFSAETSDSAITSVSAQTSVSAVTSVSATVATDAVHASAATKVDSALTMTDVAGTNSVVFDGSDNQTVTFGTATSIANENSMEMDANGVVDVNIIDCGEY